MGEFQRQFRFKPELAMMVGIERECFLVRDGLIVSIAPEIIPMLNNPAISYELSACQLESHVGPAAITSVRKALEKSEEYLAKVGEKYGFQCWHNEVAPEDMPLDVYPDPQGRYQQLAKTMPCATLLAACRVAGTHIHIGMPDAKKAMAVYQRVAPFWKELSRIGDSSAGERLSIYREVVPNPTPRYYSGWKDFYASALSRGFADNPRNCWDLIRISRHGTIEFRMFGATSDLDRIEKWAKKCWNLCQL